MNTGHKTIVAMLAVVAVLLVVNIVQGPRTAEAQDVTPRGEPYVVKWLPWNAYGYFRVWSDGQIDAWTRPEEGGFNCDNVFTFDSVVVPASSHPFPVVDADVSQGNFTMEFRDGRIDFCMSADGGIRCTIAGDGSAPLCLGDADRDGDNDFDDLLYVLSGWGECE